MHIICWNVLFSRASYYSVPNGAGNLSFHQNLFPTERYILYLFIWFESQNSKLRLRNRSSGFDKEYAFNKTKTSGFDKSCFSGTCTIYLIIKLIKFFVIVYFSDIQPKVIKKI